MHINLRLIGRRIKHSMPLTAAFWHWGGNRWKIQHKWQHWWQRESLKSHTHWIWDQIGFKAQSSNPTHLYHYWAVHQSLAHQQHTKPTQTCANQNNVGQNPTRRTKQPKWHAYDWEKTQKKWWVWRRWPPHNKSLSALWGISRSLPNGGGC